MTTKPTTKIRHADHQGVDILTQEQFDAVSKALRLPRNPNHNAFGQTQHRGSIQNIINTHLHGHEVEHLAAENPAAFTELAMAFGHRDPKNLTNTGRIELEYALQNRIADLVTR